MIRPLRCCLWIAVLIFAGCTVAPNDPAPPPRPSLNGVILAPGVQAWPAGSVLELRLVDFSKSNEPAIVIAEQSISEPGAAPLRFRLPYNPGQIDSRHDYGLECRVLVGGRVRWSTPQIFPVLTRGRAIVVELSLQPVAVRGPESHAR